MDELNMNDKRMKLRYAGKCRLCGVPFSPGSEAIHEPNTKTVRCVQCPQAFVEPNSDVAGASARREHERRQRAREQSIRAAHPTLGGLILAYTEEPQHTRAWETGAIGEERLARHLEHLPDSTRVLHDRRIRGSRANIDHIVISPAGVWVIDAKRYKDKRPSLRVDGGLFRSRVETLRIGNSDGSRLVSGIHGQTRRVVDAVGDPGVPIHPVLCFIEADWPYLGGDFTVDGVSVLWPKLLVKRIKAAGSGSGSGAVDVAATRDRVAAAFPRSG